MSTHNIGFYEDLTKIILNYHQISSYTHLISSAGLHWFCYSVCIFLKHYWMVQLLCSNFSVALSAASIQGVRKVKVLK